MRLLLLIFIHIIVLNLFSQTPLPTYTANDKDKIAVIYLHCKNEAPFSPNSKQILKDYFFGDDNINKKFFDENLHGKYHYEGEVFGPVELPYTEEAFSFIGKKTFLEHLQTKLSAEKKRIENEKNRLEAEVKRLEDLFLYNKEEWIFDQAPQKIGDEIAKHLEYMADVWQGNIVRQKEQNTLQKELLTPNGEHQTEIERLDKERIRLDQELTRLKEHYLRLDQITEIPESDLNATKIASLKEEAAAKKAEYSQILPALLGQINEIRSAIGVPQPKSLSIAGFNKDNFDKIIYLFSESSYGSVGNLKSGLAFHAEDHPFKNSYEIYLNDEKVIMPSTTNFPISNSSMEDYCSGPGEKVPSVCNPGIELWGRPGVVILHEWLHLLQVAHANKPCGDGACKAKEGYEMVCPDYFQFTCSEKEVGYGYATLPYGDVFDVMGLATQSISLNAAARDKIGVLPDQEKVVVSPSGGKKNINLIPLEKRESGIRCAIIEIEGAQENPLIYLGRYTDDLPTANIKLYAEYRRPIGFDKNLISSKVSRNTEGLMIRLAFDNTKINQFTYQNEKGEDVTYSEKEIQYDTWYSNATTWLLDMTPKDGITSVTLNKGFQFYQNDWGLRIYNIDPNGNKGITFDVAYGKKEGINSGVYKTGYFSGDEATLAALRRPLFYSDDLTHKLVLEKGKLLVKKVSDNKEVWKGEDEGVPVNKDIDKFEFENGRLNLYAEGEMVWSTGETDDDSKAILIITSKGELNILDENEEIIWPEPETSHNLTKLEKGKEGTVEGTNGLLYRTALFNRDEIVELDDPILYSSNLKFHLIIKNGDVIIENIEQDKITWKLSDYIGLKPPFEVDKLYYDGGRINIWAGPKEKFKLHYAYLEYTNASNKVIVTNDGQLNFIDKKGNVIRSAQGQLTQLKSGGKGVVEDKDGNLYRTMIFEDDEVKDLNKPIIYSSDLEHQLIIKEGDLVVIKGDNITWRLTEYIAKKPPLFIDRLYFDAGRLNMWSSSKVDGTKTHTALPEEVGKCSAIKISQDGKLNFIRDDGTVYWPSN